MGAQVLDNSAKRDSSSPRGAPFVLVTAEGVDVDPLTNQGVGKPGEPLPFTDLFAAGRRVGPCHPGEFFGNFPAGDSVLGHAAVGLEVQQRTQTVWSEDPVDLSRFEAERVEAALEVGNVVAAHHRHPVIQHAIAKGVSGTDQRTPGIGADDAVRGQATASLETLHREHGSLVERSYWIRGGVVSKRVEPTLDIADRLAFIPNAVEPHRRIVADLGVFVRVSGNAWPSVR